MELNVNNKMMKFFTVNSGGKITLASRCAEPGRPLKPARRRIASAFKGVVAVSAVGSPAFTGPLLDPPHNPQHPKNTSFPRILERDVRRCRPLRHLHRAASSGRLPGRLCLKNSLTADNLSLVGLFYFLSPTAVAFKSTKIGRASCRERV